MKALILIGGFGTRLRPLTLSTPKPLVKFCNEPILLHQIKALNEINVTEIILAMGESGRCLEDSIIKICGCLDIKLQFSYEPKPLGTAGPLAQAKPFIENSDCDCFFVLNSDIICNYPFKQMLRFHEAHGHEGTMAIYQVDEPAKYGAVVFEQTTHRITRFQEKPDEYLSNKINAGLYIFNKSILKRIETVRLSIEIDIFPKMVADSELYCTEFKGFWMDIGQPEDYLTGMKLYLGYLFEMNSPKLLKGKNIIGNVMIDPTASVHESSLIGPNVVLGPGVIIKEGSRIRNTTILSNSVIESHCWIDSSLIAWNCEVGSWARIENTTVLGEDVKVNPELFLNGALVLPHKDITDSVYEPRTII